MLQHFNNLLPSSAGFFSLWRSPSVILLSTKFWKCLPQIVALLWIIYKIGKKRPMRVHPDKKVVKNWKHSPAESYIWLKKTKTKNHLPQNGVHLDAPLVYWFMSPYHWLPQMRLQDSFGMICLHFPGTVPSSMYQPSAVSTERACLAMIHEENINPSPPVVLWAYRIYDASHHRDAPFTGRRLEENKWYAEIMAAVKSLSPWRSFNFVVSRHAVGGRWGVTAVASL